MTRERKILLILGSLLIAFIIAAGAFSLGVYAGTEGLFNGGQQSQQMQQLPPAQQEPVQGVVGQPDLVGRVMRIEHDELIIRTAAGIRTIQLAPETRYMRHDSGQTMQAAFMDLQSGSQIAVYTVSSDDGRSMIAIAVVLIP